MKKFRNIFGGIAAAALLSSCSVTFPMAASNASIGDNVGKSETGVVFGVFYLNGDYGIKEAAKKGGITKGIATVDERTQSYIIYSKKTLIVTGE